MAYIPDEHDHAPHAEHAHPNYRAIFIVLCVCTAVSWLLDQLPEWNVPISAGMLVGSVLLVAVIKAGCVMTWFMHLKFEGNWKFIILMPTAILAVGLMVALAPDMAVHYYTNDAPQSRYPKSLAQTGHGDAGHTASPQAEPAHDPQAAPQEKSELPH